ncbi:jg25084 [Pararge aegeria aegeria]|uniref:Jg25084 protein n=1 Tax=Pararge aegeria aegeria TaxID=348720 RepID=A0A8S4R1Y1_9NEOP|nr:jg25084 [Pararge aegeria aegeria]
MEEDVNATTTTTAPTTTTKRPTVKSTKPPPAPKWVIPVTFSVGPLENGEEVLNMTKALLNSSDDTQKVTWHVIF